MTKPTLTAAAGPSQLKECWHRWCNINGQHAHCLMIANTQGEHYSIVFSHDQFVPYAHQLTLLHSMKREPTQSMKAAEAKISAVCKFLPGGDWESISVFNRDKAWLYEIAKSSART